jgi:hypothetical protein
VDTAGRRRGRGRRGAADPLPRPGPATAGSPGGHRADAVLRAVTSRVGVTISIGLAVVIADVFGGNIAGGTVIAAVPVVALGPGSHHDAPGRPGHIAAFHHDRGPRPVGLRRTGYAERRRRGRTRPHLTAIAGLR